MEVDGPSVSFRMIEPLLQHLEKSHYVFTPD